MYKPDHASLGARTRLTILISFSLPIVLSIPVNTQGDNIVNIIDISLTIILSMFFKTLIKRMMTEPWDRNDLNPFSNKLWDLWFVCSLKLIKSSTWSSLKVVFLPTFLQSSQVLYPFLVLMPFRSPTYQLPTMLGLKNGYYFNLKYVINFKLN